MTVDWTILFSLNNVLNSSSENTISSSFPEFGVDSPMSQSDLFFCKECSRFYYNSFSQRELVVSAVFTIKQVFTVCT